MKEIKFRWKWFLAGALLWFLIMAGIGYVEQRQMQMRVEALEMELRLEKTRVETMNHLWERHCE